MRILKLTGDSCDSGQVVTRTILKQQRNVAGSISPGDGERNTLGDVVSAVGERDSERLRDGSRDGNETGEELHFDGCWVGVDELRLMVLMV